MMILEARPTVPIAAPSPLVGEGITGGRPKLGWVSDYLKSQVA